MKILVTGGAGYIGSITTSLLLDSGHECVVLDDLSRGYRDAIDQRARFVEGDVGDLDAIREALQGCDSVVHFAGLIDVAESEREPALYAEINFNKPMILLREAIAQGVKRFVFSSTAAVYGEPESVPIHEDAHLKPVNPYGQSKLNFERTLQAHESADFKVVRLRYFNVAGAKPDATKGEAHEPETHIIPRVLQAMRDGQTTFEVFGNDYPTPDGTCVRDYIHVVDLAQAHLLALKHLARTCKGGVFNLGNGQGFSNREVVEACAKVTGTPVEIVYGPRRPGDPAQLVASAELAKRILGWQPERPDIHTIVEDAWRWHLAHPNGYR